VPPRPTPAKPASAPEDMRTPCPTSHPGGVRCFARSEPARSSTLAHLPATTSCLTSVGGHKEGSLSER